MAEVSIGMPVYNAAQFLDGALAALSAQGMDGLEILVSDNASTDETPDILSTWAAKDKRIRWHRQEKNLGPMPNYDWTLRNSKGAWFAFAAYDDSWSKDYVEKLHALARKPGALLAVSRIVKIDMEGRETGAHVFDEKINDAQGVDAVRLALRNANASWFYGIAEREAFTRGWDALKRYPHAWGFDPLLILPFILAGGVRGDNEAVFYRRETGSSDEKYRPKTFKAQTGVYAGFWRESLRALEESPLSAEEKLRLFPDLFRYARYGGKMRLMLRALAQGKVA